MVLLTLGRADHAEKVCQLLIPEAGAQQEGPCTPGTVGRTDPSLISATPLSDLPGIPNHQQYETRELEDEICELEGHFFKVVDKTGILLENAPANLQSLKRCLIHLPVSLRHLHVKFFAGKLSAIRNAERVEEIFDILALYWDFMNYGLLEVIVNRFGDEDTKAEMKNYLQKLREFRRLTKVRDFIEKWTHGWPPHFVNLTIEMKEEWMDRTLEDLEQFRLELSRKYSFGSYALSIQDAGPGSLRVSFALQVSFPVQSQILPSLWELFRNQGVLEVLLCGVPNREIQMHQPSLQNLCYSSNSKGKDVEGKAYLSEDSDDQEIHQKLEHKTTTVPKRTLFTQASQTDEDSTAIVQLQGKLSATAGLLKLERMGKEELLQQLVESEWQAKQAELKSKEADLIIKQLHIERNQLTAAVEQREAQIEWERKRNMELQLELEKLQEELQHEVRAHELERRLSSGPFQHEMRTHEVLPVPPVKLVMANFDKRKREDYSWYSPPFCTHQQGYRMCLRVDANGWAWCSSCS